MSITREQVERLTVEDRIAWRLPSAPRTVTMGLWKNGDGSLCTDMGHMVRLASGEVADYALAHIVSILPRPFESRPGLVYGHPGDAGLRAVHMGDGTGYPWMASNSSFATDAWVRERVEKDGWVLIRDLSRPYRPTERENDR